MGRVVREIHADNTFGPIYFIRYNRHAGWSETNTSYPFYKKSKDAGFQDRPVRFVHDMTHDPGDAALIVAIIAIGHSLNIPVLAEGIETPEQLAFLTANNCDLGQGFHIGKPMSIEALLQWFADSTRWKAGKPQDQADMVL